MLISGPPAAASGAIAVTPAAGGASLSTDTAGVGGTGAFTNLGPITLTETENPDFGPNNQANVTIILTVPAGYEFNPAQVPSINAAAGDITALAVAITATKITITYSTDGMANAIDTITVGAGGS